MEQLSFAVENDRDIPRDFVHHNTIKVKCLDVETKEIRYMNCLPCPTCGKWLTVDGFGNTDRYCGWCGQRLKTSRKEIEADVQRL